MIVGYVETFYLFYFLFYEEIERDKRKQVSEQKRDRKNGDPT